MNNNTEELWPKELTDRSFCQRAEGVVNARDIKVSLGSRRAAGGCRHFQCGPARMGRGPSLNHECQSRTTSMDPEQVDGVQDGVHSQSLPPSRNLGVGPVTILDVKRFNFPQEMPWCSIGLSGILHGQQVLCDKNNKQTRNNIYCVAKTRCGSWLCPLPYTT